MSETPDKPVALVQVILAQTAAELRLTLRRGENLLVTIAVPVVLLIFFASLGIMRVGGTRPVDFLLPGMLALAIIASGTVSLGIATAYERYYGVLKRLGASPLPRGGLIAAKALTVLATEAVQVVVLVMVAIVLYQWRFTGDLGVALLALILGSLTFAALGLAMAGALRAETTLAAANGLYLLFLLISGAILPLDHLPPAIAEVARALPAAALTTALRTALAGHGFPGTEIALLVIWAIAALAVAARTFRWE